MIHRRIRPLVLLIPLMCPGAAAIQGPPSTGTLSDQTYNVIEFLLDDIGIELLELYDDENQWPAGFSYPATPNIDAIAQDGVTFRNYWAHPVCSPDRAAALTGRHALISPRHPYGTGIGETVNLDSPGRLTSQMQALPLAHAAEGSDYVHLHVGKWHLGRGQDDMLNPFQEGGVTEYRGCLTNPNSHASHTGPSYEGNYARYTQTVSNELGTLQAIGESTWLGSHEVGDSLELLPTDDTPFILRHWFHYSHSPWRDPVPDEELALGATMRGSQQFPLAETVLTYTPASNPADPDKDPNTYHFVLRRVKAGLEAADKAIGDVLAGLTPAQRRKTMIIIRSDNGTDGLNLDPSPSNATPTSPSEPPPSYNPSHCKGTMYQQGINVPLIIGPVPGTPAPAWIKPSLRGTKVDAICSTVDIWATMAEATLPHWRIYQTDGESLMSVLSGEQDQIHPYVFSFHFAPIGSCWREAVGGEAVVRDQAGFKLLRRHNSAEELYDLSVDPLEANNLLPPQTPEQIAAYASLRAALDNLLSPQTSSTFCFGSGVFADCPCGNNNDGSLYCGRAGCANSYSSAGTALVALGEASVSQDHLYLRTFGAPPRAFGVFLQFDSLLNGGFGLPFSDGLSCVGGMAFRLETARANDQGYASTTRPVSLAGNVHPGDLKRYQFWYRDSVHGQCTSRMNWSNGAAVQWTP